MMDQSFEFVVDEKIFLYRDRLEKVEKDVANLILLIDRMINLIQGTRNIPKKDDDAILANRSNCSGSVLFRDIR